VNVESWGETRRVVLARDGYRCTSCGIEVVSREADIHHLLPRSMGGTDELANLVTLCDGCHAAHHPMLAGGLARRVLERWAVRIARLFGGSDDFNAMEHLGPALRLLGVDRFREGQLAIVQAALKGKSILVVRPTGSGKTLCFQLPAVLTPGATVVVSPLKALMAEQVSALLRKKVPASFVNSDLSSEEKRLRYALLRHGAIKLLHLAPERFFVQNDAERARLASLRPAFLVVDEAHCIDQWGADFRPEYGRLGEIRRQLGNPPVLAFTATAGQEMQERIMASLGAEDAEVFVSGVDRPNITLLRWAVAEDARASGIAELLSLPLAGAGKAMVFVPSARVGDDLQAALRALGMDVPLYHSKLGRPFEREQLVKRFTNQSEPVIDRIIATSAFGMGIDVPSLRLVIHWQAPASVEDLMQELGRAGRDGRQSVSIVMHDNMAEGRDVKRLRFMADLSGRDHETPDPAARANRMRKIAQVSSMMRHEGCYRGQLVDYFGGKVRARRSFAVRILEWLFSSRSRVRRTSHCCDFCDREEIGSEVAYAATVLDTAASFRRPAGGLPA
jgi:ATP-dependent DNA helicase RecQ